MKKSKTITLEFFPYEEGRSNTWPEVFPAIGEGAAVSTSRDILVETCSGCFEVDNFNYDSDCCYGMWQTMDQNVVRWAYLPT